MNREPNINVEITGSPKLHGSAVDLEYAAAKEEGRQPNCPYCGKPLEIRMVEDGGVISWIWDEAMGCYDMQSDGTSHAPCCARCLKPDWDFIDHDLVEF